MKLPDSAIITRLPRLRRLSIWRFAFPAAGALLLALAACGNNDKNGAELDAAQRFQRSHPRIVQSFTTKKDGMARIVTADPASSLDPHKTDDGGSVKVFNQIYETLVRVDPNDVNVLHGELAERWETAADSMSMTFFIRQGIAFHDGALLDAAAVKLSIDRARAAVFAAPEPAYASFYDFIAGVEADGMKLSIAFTRPVARIALRNFSMFSASIVSPALIRATEGMDAAQRSAYISAWASGTGPFFLADHSAANGRVTLRRFDGYWRGKPRLDGLVFEQIKDARVRVEHLKSGTAQVVDDVPRADWDSVERMENVALHRWWALNLCYLGLNLKHPKMRDKALRRAIQLAVDRGQLEELYYGSARATYSVVAQPFAEYDPALRPEGSDLPTAERQSAARRMLENTKIAETALTLFYPMDDRPYLPTPNKVADKVRQQLEAVGLNVTIQAVANAELFAGLKSDKYEMVLIGWMSDNGDPDNFYGPLADGDAATGTPGSSNAARLYDASFHQALVEAQKIESRAERVTAYRAMEKRLQNEFIGHVPLLNTQQAVALGGAIEGVEIDGLGHYRFHAARLKR